MATLSEPSPVTIKSSNVYETALDFTTGDPYEVRIGRGNASTPLTPDPLKLYQRVVTTAEYKDTRKYKNRLFKNEIVDGGIGIFYKVLKDVDISWKDDGTTVSWATKTLTSKYRNTPWIDTSDNLQHFTEIYSWIKDGNYWLNYTIEYKLVASGEIVEVNRSLINAVAINPTICLDNVPKIGEKWGAEGSSTSFFIYNVIASPTLPLFTDTSVYLALPTKLVSYYYISPIRDQLLIDKNNTTIVTAAGDMSVSFYPTADFNSITLAEMVSEYFFYVIHLKDGTQIQSGNIYIDCDVDADGILGKKPVTKLIKLDRIYTLAEIDYIQVQLRFNQSTYYETSLGYVGVGMAVSEGLTEYNITASLKDYNNYTPDAWGEIAESVKPIRRTFSISVVVPFADFDKTYRRHLAMKGKIITLDGTDGVLDSLTARGIITDISHATMATNGRDIDSQYKYKMTFLEVV